MAAHLGSPALAGLKRQAGFTDSAAKPKAPRVDDFEEQQEEQGELDEAQQPELTETLKVGQPRARPLVGGRCPAGATAYSAPPNPALQLGMLNLHGKEQDIMRKASWLAGRAGAPLVCAVSLPAAACHVPHQPQSSAVLARALPPCRRLTS